MSVHVASQLSSPAPYLAHDHPNQSKLVKFGADDQVRVSRPQRRTLQRPGPACTRLDSVEQQAGHLHPHAVAAVDKELGHVGDGIRQVKRRQLAAVDPHPDRVVDGPEAEAQLEAVPLGVPLPQAPAAESKLASYVPTPLTVPAAGSMSTVPAPVAHRPRWSPRPTRPSRWTPGCAILR